MAWTCSGHSNDELIMNMWRADLIKSERVRNAMLAVDRAHYTPDQRYAYEDSPQSIGHGATISAPHMHASAAEYLQPYLGAGKRVLDVGSGSGYLTAVLAELCFSEETHGDRQGAKVVGLEHIKELRDMGERNIRKSEQGKKWVEGGKVEFVVGDGRLGWKDADGRENGWDAIHVGAAATEIHDTLVEQLRKPGRMFIPVEHPQGMGQHIWVVDKDDDGKVSKKMLYGVRYVPLTDAPE